MCPKISAICISEIVEINTVEFPLYMGYLSSKEILEIAKVPSFATDKTNVGIARGIPPHEDPVVDWQRPVIPDKISDISKIYSSTSENNLMPNPVIISVNPLLAADSDVDVKIQPFHAQLGQQKKQFYITYTRWPLPFL